MSLAILSHLKLSRDDALRVVEQVVLGLDDDAGGTLLQQSVLTLLDVIGDELRNAED
jgi:hypothetical protein